MSDFEFWGMPHAVREGAFKTLRRERPIAYFELQMPEGNSAGMPDDFWSGGVYLLSKYKDIVDASRQPEIFCSGQGATSVFDMPAEMREYFGSMIEMDDPKHKRLRDIVNKAFTVRQVRMIEEYVDRAAREVIDSIGPKGEVDFVTECSSRLPLEGDLRHDGRPRVAVRLRVQLLEHDPRSRRSRVHGRHGQPDAGSSWLLPWDSPSWLRRWPRHAPRIRRMT